MQPIQRRLYDFLVQAGEFPLKLRELGRHVNVHHPQKVKYHLLQLFKKGLIVLDDQEELIRVVKRNTHVMDVEDGMFISIPVFGAANCGSASIFANHHPDGFLKTSPGLLKGRVAKNVLALQASGDSMNNSNVDGQAVDDGDYILVDVGKKVPDNGDYVVSVIDGCVNVKKYLRQDGEGYITLISDSKKNYPPIFIDENDSYDYVGQVFKVLKVAN